MKLFLALIIMEALLFPTVFFSEQTNTYTPAISPAQSKENFNLQSLKQAISRFAEDSGGIVGVTAIHVETGREVSMNGGMRFPLASVFKIFVALELMSRVERGELHLNDGVTLSPKDFRPGNSPLAEMARDTPVVFTIDRLLFWMLAEGDNSATDALLRLVGGPVAVTANLRSMGIADIDVNRTEVEMFFDIMGVRVRPPERDWSLHFLNDLAAAVSAEDRRTAAAQYANDLRDTATPDALAGLLVKLQQRKLALKPDSVERLLRIMIATTTGPERLKALLPFGAQVAHKTGGAAGSRNDVGIVTLPDKAGHVAIAVFIKASMKDDASRDRTIAEISRTVYDYFLLQGALCVRKRKK